ncbi:MAG: RDD family protein [Holophaga sp.]|nr:RDD family protein [Holophaga sp.]
MGRIGDNPAPAFLQPYLPGVPDDAQPLISGGAIERGDFGTRFVAYLIDMGIWVLLFIVFIVASAVLGAVSHGITVIFSCLLYPFLGLGYMVFMLWSMVKFRATIGKKIMKLRVVPEMNPTGNIDWGQAILRLVGHWVSGMLACLPYLLILGADRKGFQDMFSNSIVIKVDR